MARNLFLITPKVAILEIKNHRNELFLKILLWKGKAEVFPTIRKTNDQGGICAWLPSFAVPWGSFHSRRLSPGSPAPETALFSLPLSHIADLSSPCFWNVFFLCLVKVPPVKCSFTFVEHSYRVARYNYKPMQWHKVLNNGSFFPKEEWLIRQLVMQQKTNKWE